MCRVLVGLCVEICAVGLLNAGLLLFTPLGAIPLQGIYFFWHKVFGALSLAVWASAAFGSSVLACRITGRMEGLVSLSAVLLATALLVGFVPALSLGSVIMSLPLLFVFYVGGLVAFFGRRPDMA